MLCRPFEGVERLFPSRFESMSFDFVSSSIIKKMLFILAATSWCQIATHPFSLPFPRSYIVFAYLRDSEICFPTTPLIQFATTEATALPRTYLNRPVASIPASLAFLFFNDDEIITVRFSPQNGTAFHHREYSWLMKPPCFGASVSAYFVFLCGESMRYRGGFGLGGHERNTERQYSMASKCTLSVS